MDKVTATQPAGASTSQLLHYAQEYSSKRFRRYDYGISKNLLKYGQTTPTDYTPEKITALTHLYCGDNDLLSNITDVKRLAALMPNVASFYEVPLPEYTHLDLLWAINVKDMINNLVLENMQAFDAAN